MNDLAADGLALDDATREALEKLRALYVQALPALVVIEDLLGVPPEEQCVRRERLETGESGDTGCYV
jgi:hypothetical protein